jgi:hypothetical protein
MLACLLCPSIWANPNSSLINRSPFLPQQTLSKPSHANILKDKIPFPELQFVGFSGTAPDWSFALFFNPQNQVKWLHLGAEFAGVKVVQFNASIPSLTVEHAGQRKDVKLAQSAPPLTPHQPRQPSRPNHNQASAVTLPGQSKPKESSQKIPRRRIILPKITQDMIKQAINSDGSN